MRSDRPGPGTYSARPSFIVATLALVGHALSLLVGCHLGPS